MKKDSFDIKCAVASGGVAALDRAFGILSSFVTEDEILTLAELARRTGLYKSTILRLLISLEHGGFTRRLSDGRYTIGPEPLRLAHIYQDSYRIRHIIQPILQDLCRDSGEASSFYVREGNSRVVLYRVESARAARRAVHEGERLPVECGASGKVLMAFATPQNEGLEEVRENLYSVSFGERDAATASASAPAFGNCQELKGALTLSGPRERFTPERVRVACRILLAAASRASAALGGNPALFSRGLERLI